MSIYSGVNIPFSADTSKFIEGMTLMRGAIGKFSADLNGKLVADYNKLDSYNKKLDKGIGRLAETLKTTGTSLSTYLTLPLGIATAASFKAHAEIDALGKAFNVVTENVKITEKYLTDFQTLAKNPGLGFMEVSQAALRWMNLGDSVEVAKRKIAEFGNANALAGGGKTQFDTIMYQLSQMQSKGKILSEDLKPILSASPVIAKSLMDRYGATDPEMISKQLEAKGLSAKNFINQLTDDLSKLGRAQDSAKNSLDNFSDSMFISGANVGELVNKNGFVTALFNNLSSGIVGITGSLKELDGGWRTLVLGIAGLAFAAGPAMVALGGLVSVMGMLNNSWTIGLGGLKSFSAYLLANPWVAAAVGITVLRLALYALNDNTTAAEKSQAAIADAMSRANTAIAESAAKTDVLIDKIKNENLTRETRQKYLNEYIALNPTVLHGLTLESMATSEGAKAIAHFNFEQQKKIKLLELEAKVIAAKNIVDKGKPAPIDYAMTNGLGLGATNYFHSQAESEYNTSKKMLHDSKVTMRNIATEEFQYTTPKAVGKGGSGAGAGKADKLTDAEWRAGLEEKARQLDIANGDSIDPFIANLSGKGTTALGTNFGSLGIDTEAIQKNIQESENLLKAQNFNSILKEQNDMLQQGFANMIGSVAVGMGEFLGEWMKGTVKFSEIGAVLRNLIGQSIMDLGKAMISMGSTKLAEGVLKTIGLTNPIGAGAALIGLGVGAVAIGSALKSGNTSGASGGGGSSYKAGGSVSNNTPTFGTSNSNTSGGGRGISIDLNLSGMFTVRGDDLVYILNQKRTTQARIN